MRYVSAMLSAMAFVLAQSGAGAWSTGRPPECGDPPGQAVNVWERAKSPELRRYCDLVANASSKLVGTAIMAQSALDDAREANGILPGRAAPRALEGRALAALGHLDEALVALQDARARDPGVFDDPQALFAWARVLARTGHPRESAAAYRTLLPRASALSSADRFVATTEAGLVALACGPSTLDEAVAAFRESLRTSQTDAEAVAVFGLALALDRRGEGDEARALLSNRGHGDPRSTLSGRRARELLAAAPAEVTALTALGLEAVDAPAAHQAWESYLSSAPAGPWAAHARLHLAASSSARGSRGASR